MTNVNSVVFGQNLSEYLNDAIYNRQVIFVENGQDQAVLMSEKRYRELEKAERNAEYLRKIEKGWEDIRAGNVIVKTLDELKAAQKALENGDA